MLKIKKSVERSVTRTRPGRLSPPSPPAPPTRTPTATPTLGKSRSKGRSTNAESPNNEYSETIPGRVDLVPFLWGEEGRQFPSMRIVATVQRRGHFYVINVLPTTAGHPFPTATTTACLPASCPILLPPPPRLRPLLLPYSVGMLHLNPSPLCPPHVHVRSFTRALIHRWVYP